MNSRKRTGIVVMLFCMAAILAVVWYCLFAVGRRSSHIDGTFVEGIDVRIETEMAA